MKRTRATGAPTPGKWAMEQVKGSYQVPYHVTDGKGKLVASADGDQLTPSATSIAEAEANAALIVRAVNSHADLLAACEALLKVVSAGTETPESKAALDAGRLAVASAKDEGV
jgi:hypothetical protein